MYQYRGPSVSDCALDHATLGSITVIPRYSENIHRKGLFMLFVKWQ